MTTEKEKANTAMNVASNAKSLSELRSQVKTLLTADVDYGIIPHTGNKPTLYKSGAEKIIKYLELNQNYELTDSIKDFDKGVFYYEFRCTLSNDEVFCSGVGCCNTMESKYSKQNAYTLANTIIKMARKRAMIDATLSASGLSDMFTQDVEDLDVECFDEKPKVYNVPAPKPSRNPKTAKETEAPPDNEWFDSIVAESETQCVTCSDCGVELTDKVAKYSTEKLGKPLCFKCQKGGK